jgi:methyl-accepting chemotaxis protein
MQSGGILGRGTKKVQALINDSMEKVEAGNQLAEETGNTLDEIVNYIKDVAQYRLEINFSSQERLIKF